MNTATFPDCKTLVQLAADHPEKLEAINEFLKNIIVLVDLTGKEDQKEAHGFTVETKTLINLRSLSDFIDGKTVRPSREYFVTITDGKRTARFMNNGDNVLTLADFASGTNLNGLEFWAHRSEPGRLHKKDVWRKGQKKNVELCDMQEFINACLSVPVKYAKEGKKTYTY